MKVKELINELKYYQMYLGELISVYHINEAICDLADNNKTVYASYGNCLGQISSALVHHQHILCDIMLRWNKKCKCIPRTIDRVFNEPFMCDETVKEKIKAIFEDLKTGFNSVAGDLDNLNSYRNNVYAHFCNSVFSTQWQVEFKAKHPFDYDKILSMAEQCFDGFSKVLNLLSEEPYEGSICALGDINRMVGKLSQI